MLLNVNPKKTLVILLFLGLVMLSIPAILRVGFLDSALITADSYSSFRLGEIVKEKGFVNNDNLSFGGREIRYEYGLPFLISLFPKFMVWFLPILFGLISLFLFYLIARKYDADIALISSALLLLSPTFLYLYSASLKFSGGILFCLLGIYFFINKNSYRYYAYLSFLIVGFFSVEFAVLLLLAGVFFVYKKKILLWDYLIFLILMVGLLYWQFRSWLLNPGLFFNFDVTTALLDKILNVIFDIGHVNGFGIFIFILGLIGIFALWKLKYKYLLGYALFFIALILISYMPYLIYILNFGLVILAACGIIYLIDSDWKSSTLRSLSLLVILCGVLFSGLSFLHVIGQIEPGKEMVEGMKFLEGLPGTTSVFSDASRGVYINFVGKYNVLDTNFLNAPQLSMRVKDSERLLHTTKIEEARDIIYKYDIRYIWLDRDLKQKLYINDQSELLFLLKYSPGDFLKVFDNSNVEIWEVLFKK